MPCSLVHGHQYFRRTQFLKIGTAGFSKTQVPIYQNIHSHIPEEGNLDNDHYENLKHHMTCAVQ